MNNLDFPLDIPLHSRFGSISETHIFSNTLVNEFRFGINIISDRLHNKAPVTGAASRHQLATATGVNGQAGDPNMYRLHFENFEIGPYTTELQSALSDNFAWLDTLSWTQRAHQLRMGGEIDRVTLRRNLPTGDNGYVFFIPVPPATPQQISKAFFQVRRCSLMAAVVLATTTTASRAAPGLFRTTGVPRKTLTLNLGFRNEFVGAPYDLLCHTGNTNPLLAATTGQPFVYPKCVNKFDLIWHYGNSKSGWSQQRIRHSVGATHRLCLRCRRAAHHLDSRAVMAFTLCAKTWVR